MRRNIYADKYGLEAVVQVGNEIRTHRWPHDTPVAVIEAWVEDTRETLHDERPKTPRGSLGADAERYYKTVRHLTGFVARRAEIRAWIAALGAKTSRWNISEEDVRRVRGEWHAAGKAPKTINQRVYALGHLYRSLDGHKTRTPVDDVKPMRVVRLPKVRVADDLVRTIYQRLLEKERAGELRDAKTRARFMVFASTGHRPSEIGRAQPGDVDLERRLGVPRDGKGGFCPGVYLNDDMLEAWKLFASAKAWGEFDSGSFASRLRAAGFPPHLRLYQLRHTIGIHLSEAGVDIQDVADHLGHKSTAMTRRHYVPVIGTRLQKVSEKLGDRQLGWKSTDK